MGIEQFPPVQRPTSNVSRLTSQVTGRVKRLLTLFSQFPLFSFQLEIQDLLHVCSINHILIVNLAYCLPS